MSRYSHVNPLEVEDSVGDRVSGLQGRFGRKHLDSRDLGVSHWRYAPDFRASFAHSHREQEEAYVVVAGIDNAEIIETVHSRRAPMIPVTRGREASCRRCLESGVWRAVWQRGLALARLLLLFGCRRRPALTRRSRPAAS